MKPPKNARKLTVKEQGQTYNESDHTEQNPFVVDRYEIINGSRYDLKPSPTFNHQKLVTQLMHSIHKTCYANGEIVVAPMDVFFDED